MPSLTIFARSRVGGGDDAHVDLDGLLSPMRSNSRSCRTRSSFICNAIGIVPTSSRKSVPLSACSMRPCRDRDGAGERAAHVAEQLGFEQRFGNGAAVDGDERLRGGAGLLMNGARDHLLAGAGLAVDQDRRAVGATVSMS